MNDLIHKIRKTTRNRAINNCDAVATRNSPPDIAVGNARCSEPAMPKIDIAAAACRACFLYLSNKAKTPAKDSANPNPLGISAVALERPVRTQLNTPSMISAKDNPMVVFAMVTPVSETPQAYSQFELRPWFR